MNSLKNNRIKGEKGSEEEKERAKTDKSKCRLLQWSDEFHDVQLSGLRSQSRLDCEIANNQQPEDHKSNCSHNPGEVDLGDEFIYHDTHDNTTQ